MFYLYSYAEDPHWCKIMIWLALPMQTYSKSRSEHGPSVPVHLSKNVLENHGRALERPTPFQCREAQCGIILMASRLARIARPTFRFSRGDEREK
jgi:hypothetical protein